MLDQWVSYTREAIAATIYYPRPLGLLLKIAGCASKKGTLDVVREPDGAIRWMVSAGVSIDAVAK